MDNIDSINNETNAKILESDQKHLDTKKEANEQHMSDVANSMGEIANQAKVWIDMAMEFYRQYLEYLDQLDEERVRKIDDKATIEINQARRTAVEKGWTAEELANYENKVLKEAQDDKDKIAEESFNRNRNYSMHMAAIAANLASIQGFAAMLTTTGNPYVSGVFAALVLAQGLISANFIRRQKYQKGKNVELAPSPKFNLASSSSGGRYTSFSDAQAPDSTAIQTELNRVQGVGTERIGQKRGERQDMRAYVSERDIRTVSNNIDNINSLSEIG
jgi:hypothetical protein